MQRPTQSTLQTYHIDNIHSNDSAGNNMTTSKNAKETIVVNFKEIPETICVQTRFITSMVAKQKKNDLVFYMTTRNGNVEVIRSDDHMESLRNYGYNLAKKPSLTVSIRQKPGQMPTPPAVSAPIKIVTPTLIQHPSNMGNNNNFGVMANNNKANMPMSTVTIPFSNPPLYNYNMSAPILTRKPVETKDTGSMTNPRPIYQDRVQQTDPIAQTQSVAIQCQMEDDFEVVYEWPETVEEDPPGDPSNVDIGKEEFLQYVKENTVTYSNHLRECLICGEVFKKATSFYGHMAIHRGPKILCFECGQYLEHKALLQNHHCQQAKLMEKALLRCPHYCCGTLAISRLELYDHINEHNNYRIHKCTACRKGFCTTQEFLRHLLLRAKCYTRAKRRRSNLYGLESHRDRLCRVRVFTLYTDKRRTTLVKTFLSQRSRKQNKCKICLKSYRNKFVLKRHYLQCLATFQKRLGRKGKHSRKAKN